MDSDVGSDDVMRDGLDSLPALTRMTRRGWPRLRVTRGGDGVLPVLGDGVETTSRPILVGRNLWVFPLADHQAHLLKPPERAIQRSVGGEQSGVGGLLQLFGDEVTVESIRPACAQHQGSRADGELQRHEASGFSAHRHLYTDICR